MSKSILIGLWTAVQALFCLGIVASAQEGQKEPDPTTGEVTFKSRGKPTDPEGMLNLAKKHFANCNIPAAVEVLETLLARMDPGNAAARLQLGRLYGVQRRLPEAIAQLESLIADDPNNIAAKCQLAVVYNQGGQAQKALEIVEPILAQQPDQVDALLAKGQAMMVKNEPAEGEKIFKRVIELDPNNYMAYYLLGRQAHTNRQYLDAVVKYRKSLSIQVQHGMDPVVGIPTFEYLAKIYLDLGEYDKAIQMADQALPVSPRKFELNYILGMAHGMMQHYEKAEEHMSKAIEMHPNDFVSRIRYAFLLETQNKLEEALAQYEAAKSLNPTHFYAYSQIGYLLEKLGRKEEARFAYQKSVDLDPKVAAPYCLYANFLKEEGNGQGAVKYLENAIRVDPLNAQAYYAAAQILSSSGDADQKKKGQQYMQTFERLSPYKNEIDNARSQLEISPQRANAYLFLAARYQDLGMLDQALQTLNDGLSADPNSVLVLKQRGLLYVAMDKKDLARQDLTKAIAAMPDDYDLKTALETIK